MIYSMLNMNYFQSHIVENVQPQFFRGLFARVQDKQNQDKMKGFTKIVRKGAQPIRDIADLSTLDAYR
jgi:hypothetical protein